MLIIPTIYLRNHRVANPAPEAHNPLPTDPRALADQFRTAGVEMVHVVDLDIPTAGHLPHEEIIMGIVRDFGLHCQVTGNIRTADIAKRYFDAGAARIILGPLAYQKPAFAQELTDRFPGKVGIEIAVKNKKVVIKGWAVAAHKSAADYLERFRDMGITMALYSDVNEHDAITPANFGHIREFTAHAQLPVIHNTDLSSVDELLLLLHLEKFGLMGTILGKSLYEGRFDMNGLITMTKEQELRDGEDDSTLLPE